MGGRAAQPGSAAPWFVIPWDWEELVEWLEDQEAEEMVLE